MFASTNSSSTSTRGQKHFAASQNTSTPRKPLASRLNELKGTTDTAQAMTPPPGVLFMTGFDCKYYGSSTVDYNASKHISGQQCAALVKQGLRENNRRHTSILMRITDQGLSIIDHATKQVATELGVEQLRRIVPGTLKSKHGKLLRVAIIVERFASAGAQVRFHIIQLKNSSDLGFVAEATRRMWRDHMFQNLLDVSTEEGQNMFDSFTIEQDIEAATKRCSALATEEVYSFEKALEGLLAGGGN